LKVETFVSSVMKTAQNSSPKHRAALLQFFCNSLCCYFLLLPMAF